MEIALLGLRLVVGGLAFAAHGGDWSLDSVCIDLTGTLPERQAA